MNWTQRTVLFKRLVQGRPMLCASNIQGLSWRRPFPAIRVIRGQRGIGSDGSLRGRAVVRFELI
jgi:hypothetical protein